jgi:hypothetical protein
MGYRSLSLELLAVVLTLFVRAGASPQDNGKSTATPPEIIILTGNPMGSVRFRHRLHTDVREIQCLTCHHASKPQMPATAPEQACRTCHTGVVTGSMVTNTRAAFHNEDATEGLCINCHRKENAEHKHKLAPVKCLECHNKANVLPDPTAGR